MARFISIAWPAVERSPPGGDGLVDAQPAAWALAGGPGGMFSKKPIPATSHLPRAQLAVLRLLIADALHAIPAADQRLTAKLE